MKLMTKDETVLRAAIREILMKEYDNDGLEEGLGKYVAGAALGLGLALGSPGKAVSQDISKDDVNKPKIEKTIEKKSNFDNAIEPDNNYNVYDYKDFAKMAKEQKWEKVLSGGFNVDQLLSNFDKNTKFKVLSVIVGNMNLGNTVAIANYGDDFKYTRFQYFTKSGTQSYKMHYVYPMK